MATAFAFARSGHANSIHAEKAGKSAMPLTVRSPVRYAARALQVRTSDFEILGEQSVSWLAKFPKRRSCRGQRLPS